MLRRQLLVAIATSCAACLAPLDETEFDTAGAEATLLITTTDFSTGSLSVFHVETREMELDVALGATDSFPFAHDGLVYLLHRFTIDRIDVRDPEDGWALLAQHALSTATGTSANPQAMTFADDGYTYVTQYGEAALRVMDLGRPSGSADIDTISLAEWADADGLLEAGPCHARGPEVFVFAQRLDQGGGWGPVDSDIVLVVDTESRSVMDEMPSLGQWVRQIRIDPSDTSRLFLLSTGIAVLDLEGHAIEWIVDEEAFAAAGITDPVEARWLPQSFDVSPDGRLWLAAYTPGFGEVRIYRAGEGEVPELVVAEGFDSVDRTLEVVGEELWFGDITPGASGLRGFDITVDPPRALADQALSTGLPPFSITAM